MTLTAVQELAGNAPPRCAYRSAVFCGAPVAHRQGAQGRICLFRPGTLVGYELAIGPRTFGFVFRTLAEADSDAYAVAGVRPGVRLLISATSAAQVARLKEFLLRITDARGGLEHVSDALLLRATSAIFGRREIVQLVDGLRE